MTVKKKNKIVIHIGVFALFLLISFDELVSFARRKFDEVGYLGCRISIPGTYVGSDQKSYITTMESTDA